MKKHLFFRVVLLFFISLMFSNCEKVKDLTDIDFDATLKADVSATSASAATNELKAVEDSYPFSGSAVIDPTSNADIEKHWKKIREWQVKKITVKIKSISEPANLLYGDLTISDESTESVLLEKHAENMSLSAGSTVMTISGSDFGKIVSALDAKHSLKVKVSGALDKPSVSVTYQVIIDLKVTANIFE